MIYLDNAATTKPSITALEKAQKFNEDAYFNPSALYLGGILAQNEIKQAKEVLLSMLGAINHDIIFTSCGSESDNQAIFCAVKRGTFVTTEGEHSAVYKSFIALKDAGFKVHFAPLNKNGSVNTEKLYEFIKNTPDVTFVSIVHVNNETGAINDINKIAKNVKAINDKIVFHSDGVQGFGKLYYKLAPEVDLYSVSAHKIHALKGVGALYKKKGLNIKPLIYGGGQESGLRSGTENVFGIKVFEYASKEKASSLKEDYKKMSKLKEIFLSILTLENFTIISDENCSPYILSLSANGLKGEVITHTLENDGIVIGNGSACSAKTPHSRVLTACGYSREVLDGVVRISFSKFNTEDEVIFSANALNNAVKKLKEVMNR